jgi:hypothetical protein
MAGKKFRRLFLMSVELSIFHGITVFLRNYINKTVFRFASRLRTQAILNNANHPLTASRKLACFKSRPDRTSSHSGRPFRGSLVCSIEMTEWWQKLVWGINSKQFLIDARLWFPEIPFAILQDHCDTIITSLWWKKQEWDPFQDQKMATQPSSLYLNREDFRICVCRGSF